MQAVPITTNVVSSNPTQVRILDTELMIKFVGDLRQVGDFPKKENILVNLSLIM
jgi:hypothetical protein